MFSYISTLFQTKYSEILHSKVTIFLRTDSKFVTFQVHSLFSRLSLHHAFVTRVGRLVGIISLDEVSFGSCFVFVVKKIKSRDFLV